MPNGFIIAAPHSGSGKTTVTLGLLRHLAQQQIAIDCAKTGPDFIDPQYHSVAAKSSCINLDPWAMRPELVEDLASETGKPLIAEAMMGLFDGAADGSGSAADLAATLGLPIVLVVDTAKQSHSIAALVQGFARFRSDIQLAGVILNKIGSARHEEMMREALGAIDVPVLGAIMRHADLALPERHLGLLQAQELPDLEDFLNRAAELVSADLDVQRLLQLKRAAVQSKGTEKVRPLGQHMAIARDEAFAFCYPHLIAGWQEQGATISFFSPLADEAPFPNADAVYFPGGYPELHAQRLSSNQNFLLGVRSASDRGAFVYGECGGYMVLGEALVDKQGDRYQMAGLLPLVTSFENRKLSLGYRLATSLSELPFSKVGSVLTCHEFHYSTIAETGACDALFAIEDARGQTLGNCGMVRANVAGSYMHLIDQKA